MRNLVINCNVTVNDNFDIEKIKENVARSFIFNRGADTQINDIRINEITDSVAEQIPPLAPEHLGWNAPDRSEILAIDKDYALMTQETFDKLPDYTDSTPTGKYNGKMWKTKGRNPDGTYVWMFAWCNHENKKLNFIDINYRQILIFK